MLMLAFWDLLCISWKWIGANSGQIQILIALAAMYLAVLGYKKVLHQIKMADDQSKESAKQTEHFAEQVKEASKQTQYAAKQFENSNLQIQELIDHRNLVLNIRNNELKSSCIELCIKTINELQATCDVLTRAKCSLSKYVGNFQFEPEAAKQINFNIENIETEIKSKKKSIQDLLVISADLSKHELDIDNNMLQQNILTINLMFLGALRSRYIYSDFTRNIAKLCGIDTI